MATTKVSELTELTSAADDDLLLVADTSVNQSKKIQKSNITEQNFTTTLKNKLDAIEASADVTDTTNVVAALTAGTNITIAADGTISATDTDTGILNVVEDTTPQLGGDLDTNGNDINFGDSDKAQFGASNDLQIYHDGSNSYVSDVGTGSLKLIGSSQVRIEDGAGNLGAVFNANTDAVLKYAGSNKLATTSTGVDVTGTVTSDGLTVDSGANGLVSTFIGGNDARPLKISNYDGDLASSAYSINAESSYGEITLQTNTTDRFKIERTGDISFYEDTGTTAKLFWDASAECLGIGTTSPLRDLHVSNGGAEGYEFGPGESSNKNQTLHYNRSTSQYIENSNRASQHTWDNGSTEVMRINSSGRLGIATNSPAELLHVYGNSGTTSLAVGDTSLVEPYGRLEANATSNVFSLHSRANFPLTFLVSTSEKMRIDSSGNLLVGVTITPNSLASAGSTQGLAFNGGTGYLVAAASSTPTAYFNRQTSDGDAAVFRKNGATVGSIGVGSGMYARADVVTDNDGSFDLNNASNFTCTPTGNITLTFTNIPDGQSGTIVLVNTGGHTISAASTTKVMGADMLTTITTAGTYVIGYISDGTNVRVYNSLAQQ